jgi:hypothetical protein
MIYKQTTKKLNKTVILKQPYILNTQHGSYFPHQMKAMVYGSLWIQQTLLQVRLPLLNVFVRGLSHISDGDWF